MNTVNLTGRLCAEPEIKTTEKNGKEMTIANFTLAVNRKFNNGTDFIRCVCFGKTADVVRDWFHKGQKMDCVGSIQTGSYDKNGEKVYWTNVRLESVEFGESRGASQNSGSPQAQPKDEPTPTEKDEFMNVDDVSDEGLPFNL